ncbi:hypothetical protein DK26_01120 [Bosea sp. WAO]|uniref:recombinase family protein n=1 Tax=Bosea sp. WAO TaxID=406341 RepID=UPI00074A7573|nr:recombinase family protein [Bosea sp. WAO]KUL97305.1 hypothetical protein DK26_01120 [Bosea sp. WAO]
MRIHHLVAKLIAILNKTNASIAAAKPETLPRLKEGAARAIPPNAMAETTPTWAPKLRVVGYARRSSAKEFNDSVERQEKLINDVAVARRGRIVDHMYVDEKGGGRTMERPALQRLLEDARNGEIDIVIVEHQDRLARSLSVINELEDLLKLHGVTLMVGWQNRFA